MIININDQYYIPYTHDHDINDKVINYILYEKYNINDWLYVSEKLDKQDIITQYQSEITKYEYNPSRINTVIETYELKIKLEYNNESFYGDKVKLAYMDLDTGLITLHNSKYDGISYNGNRSCINCDNFLFQCQG